MRNLLRKEKSQVVRNLHVVMVVDEDQESVAAIIENLESEHYSIISHSSGEDALAHFNSSEIDLVLMEASLPGISGIELLSAIRASKDLTKKAVPVLMVTSSSSIEDIDAAIAAGVNSYLVKPFRPKALRARVNQILSGKFPSE